MSYDVSVAALPGEARADFLRRVLGLTVLGLGIATFTAVLTLPVLVMVPAALSGFVPMLLILGMWAITNYVARPMVYGGAKWVGFVLGTGANGVALSFLLLVAMAVSAQSFGNPLVLIGLAAAFTFLSGVGMAAFSLMARRDFSMIGAGLGAIGLPMLVLMAAGFAFPALFGGTFGLVVGAVFVVVSAAGLLYQVNRVIHEFPPGAHVEAAYDVSIGVLALFWNILSLLMRLRR